MHLAGQGETVPRRGEQGYAMAGLIIGLAVMAILMTAAMPVWKQTVQREKEEELVFRGEQYAHAIGLFQRKSANSYPPNLDVLVQQKFLRRKYKDPVTNDEFVPLTQAAQTAQRGAQPGGQQQGQAQQGQAQQGRGQAGAGTPGAAPQSGAPAGGVIGVTSKSADQSIRLYKGRSHYNEWAFIYTPPAQAPGAGGTGAPGAGGVGGRGQGGGQPGPNPQQPPPGGGFGARGGGRGGPAGQPPPNPFSQFLGTGGRGR